MNQLIALLAVAGVTLVVLSGCGGDGGGGGGGGGGDGGGGDGGGAGGMIRSVDDFVMKGTVVQGPGEVSIPKAALSRPRSGAGTGSVTQSSNYSGSGANQVTNDLIDIVIGVDETGMFVTINNQKSDSKWGSISTTESEDTTKRMGIPPPRVE